MYSWKISLDFLLANKVNIILFLVFTSLAYPLEAIVIPQIYSQFFETINQKTKPQVVAKFLGMIALLLCVVKISDGIIHYLESIMIPKFNEYILNYIYTNILLKHQNNFSEIELGKLISRINTIPTVLRELSTDITIWVFPKFIAVLIINAYFFYLNKQLGFVSVGMILLIWILNYYMCRKCVPLSNMRHSLLEKNSEEVQNKLSNLMTIYSSGKLRQEIDEYMKGTKSYSMKYKENLDCINHIRHMNGFLDVVLFVVLNGFTAYLFFQKKISFGILMSIFITVIYYLPCISTISSSLPDLVHYMGVLGEVDGFLGEIYDHHKHVPVRPKLKLQTGDIKIKDLTFGYEGREKIFEKFNLHIPHQQKICIRGHSGNGKTTLIKLIMGYYEIPKDTIFLDHKDISKYDVNSVRSEISYVNQNNKLLNGTIYENIQYGNEISKAEIDELVMKFGIQGIYDNMPDGLNSSVGIQGANLSGGQKQLIHILRAMCIPKKIIILDEPTSAIDPKNKNIVLKVISELSKNSTLILITHDETIMNMCDRQIFIQNGKIVKDTSSSS